MNRTLLKQKKVFGRNQGSSDRRVMQTEKGATQSDLQGFKVLQKVLLKAVSVVSYRITNVTPLISERDL